MSRRTSLFSLILLSLCFVLPGAKALSSAFQETQEPSALNESVSPKTTLHDQLQTLKSLLKNDPTEKARRQRRDDLMNSITSLEREVWVKTSDGWDTQPVAKTEIQRRFAVLRLVLANCPNASERRRLASLGLGNAVYGRDIVMMKLLLNAGAKDDLTALFGAVTYEQPPMLLKMLITRGANVNIRDQEGQTPLIAVSGLWRFHEANGPEGRTTLVDADDREFARRAIIARLLIAAGANVNAVDKKGDTPFIAASQAENTEAEKLLQQYRMKVNVQNQNGFTPLMYAVGTCPLKTAAMLLHKGALVNHQAINGETALMKATASRYADMVELLLKNGARINLQDKQGNTALMKAASNEVANSEERDANRNVLSVLLQHGAKINLKNKNGLTALDLAIIGVHNHYMGSEEVVNLLEKAGAK